MGLDDYLNIDPFEEVTRPRIVVPATGAKRLASLAVRGATLRLAGTRYPPKGITEHIAELAGELPAIVGTSALMSPAVGLASRAARLPSLVGRIGGAGVTGGAVGAIQAAASGEPIGATSLQRAGEFAAGEGAYLAGRALLSKVRGRPLPTVAPPPSASSGAEKAIMEATQATPTLPAPIAPASSGAFNPDEPFKSVLTILYGPPLRAETKAVITGGVTAPKRPESLVGAFNIRDEFGTVITPEPPMVRQLPQEPNRIRIDDITQGTPEAPTSATLTNEEFPKHFIMVNVPKVGAVFVPRTPEAASVVTQVSDGARVYSIPYGPENWKWLGANPANDVVTARSGLMTSELLKRPAKEIDEILATSDGLKLGDVVAINKSSGAKELDALRNRMGLSEDDLAEIMSQAHMRHKRYVKPGPHPGREGQTAEELAKFGGKAPKGTSFEEQKRWIAEELRKRC